MSKRLSFNFVRVALIYFLIGTFWMGFAAELPAPQEELAREVYHVGRVHVMVLGWASFAIMGVIYYFVPRAAGKELYSERLGSVHFWLTNIAFLVALLIGLYLSFAIGSLEETGLPEEDILVHPTVLPLFLTYLIDLIIGFAAQFVFVYNIFRTMSE